jgi:peptide/nickel transport system substrate-binding protein
VLESLGKTGSSIAAIMREKDAMTDPQQQVKESVGSGPYIFAKDQWVPGSKAVYLKNADYASRPSSEKAESFAGSKFPGVDRIELVWISDPQTAMSALINGEIDFYENPNTDFLPLLTKARGVKLMKTGKIDSTQGMIRLNHLHPPFNNVKVRRAVLAALSQEDYMCALVGDDTALWKTLPGFFTPDTPLYTEEGGEILKGKRDLAMAKKLLAESGYSGQPVTCVVAQDQPITKAQGDVTAALLKQIGMNVDFVATDWGTVGSRRAQKTPPGQGGWGMFHTWHAGADCINPAAYNAIRANGDKAWFGWPTSEPVEKEVLAWFEAKNLDEEKTAVKRLNKAALDDVVYAPTGFFLSYTAWRKNVSGIAKGPLPFFWGVSKTA